MRLAPSGSLTWFVEYRPGTGGRRAPRKQYAHALREFTPEQACQTAKELLVGIALGRDPMADRHRERQAATFKEFAERYLQDEAKPKLKRGTVVNYEIAIRRHANSEIGSIKLDQITPADLSRWSDQTDDCKPGDGMYLLDLCYAATSNLVPEGHNPAKGIRAFHEQRRERILSSEELAKFENYFAEHRIKLVRTSR